MNVDIIIVGQGICGTLLSFELMKRGKSVLVFDEGHHQASSKAAAGLINPVTGKRFVKSWMYDRLIKAAINTYSELGELADTSVFHPTELVQFHKDETEQRAFEEKVTQEDELMNVEANHWTEFFNFKNGVGSIRPCYIVDSNRLLTFWREKLVSLGMLIEERFNAELCQLHDGILYKDFKAQQLIYCNGVSALQTPWFAALPFSLNKGEALIADIPGLPRNYIFKGGKKIIPFADNKFWVGSSFDWRYENAQPTNHFRIQTEDWLKGFLKLPFFIADHVAAERPSSIDYRPFIGQHPLYPHIGIFNGMGTKGYSQAPFFARMFAAHLCDGNDIMPEVAINRFRNLLQRFQKS